MIRFNNDYCCGAHPLILKAFGRTNPERYPGYGVDDWCAKAAGMIREAAGVPEAAVFFFPGATQANFVVAAAALASTESVIAADTGHISCHECASVENTGHKVLTLPNVDGKLTAEAVESCARRYVESGEAEYITRPAMVYLSFPTESGTLYSRAELEAISAVCRRYGMLLFVDGARMSYGLMSEANDLTLKDFGRLADVFYLGGTKCGAMFGEAVVITRPALARRFKARMKQNGAVLAKGWVLGLQFCTLLEGGLYFDIAKKADEQAMRIRRAFLGRGFAMSGSSPTNQQFVLLGEEQKRALARKYIFEDEGAVRGGLSVVRFCTSWSTSDAEVDELVADIAGL